MFASSPSSSSFSFSSGEAWSPPLRVTARDKWLMKSAAGVVLGPERINSGVGARLRIEGWKGLRVLELRLAACFVGEDDKRRAVLRFGGLEPGETRTEVVVHEGASATQFREWIQRSSALEEPRAVPP